MEPDVFLVQFRKFYVIYLNYMKQTVNSDHSKGTIMLPISLSAFQGTVQDDQEIHPYMTLQCLNRE